jgi:hypothetical protein
VSASARVQISYTLVFFLEYLGPMLIYPFFWSRTGRRYVFGLDPDVVPRSTAQDLACVYWFLHYAKVCPPVCELGLIDPGTTSSIPRHARRWSWQGVEMLMPHGTCTHARGMRCALQELNARKFKSACDCSCSL